MPALRLRFGRFASYVSLWFEFTSCAIGSGGKRDKDEGLKHASLAIKRHNSNISHVSTASGIQHTCMRCNNRPSATSTSRQPSMTLDWVILMLRFLKSLNTAAINHDCFSLDNELWRFYPATEKGTALVPISIWFRWPVCGSRLGRRNWQ